jgi:hypothetical protein
MIKNKTAKGDKELEKRISAIPAIISKQPEKTHIMENDENLIDFQKIINTSYHNLDNNIIEGSIEQTKEIAPISDLSPEELIKEFVVISTKYLKTDEMTPEKKINTCKKLTKLLSNLEHKIA